MKYQLSQRVQSIKPSPTLAVSQKAAQLRKEGKDIIDLAVGEPDFDTPDHIKDAGIKAIRDGKTTYTAVDGIPELKKAIVNKFSKDNQIQYQTNQVLVSCGGKQSFFNMSLALLNPNDEVIIPAPYWVSYPDMVRISDAKPVIIQASHNNSFKITPEQLKQALNNKTRLFIINSPSNPSGMAYTTQELTDLGEVLNDYPNVIIASDDMYEHILWPEKKFTNILMQCPDLYDRTLLLNGVSKAYAMTGWRIGYAAGPETIIASMKKVQSQSTSNPCSIAQYAATAALTGTHDGIKQMVKHFHKRHEIVIKRLQSMPGVSVVPSDGTFYSFPNFSEAIDKHKYESDVEFAEALLGAGVALVPGSAFGSAGHMRLSFAASQESLNTALDRIESFLLQNI